MKSSIETIRAEFMAGSMSCIDAVLALESLGMDAEAAEAEVWEWYGGKAEPDDGQPTEAQEWRDFDPEC